jgi:hypothetical protein
MRMAGERFESLRERSLFGQIPLGTMSTSDDLKLLGEFGIGWSGSECGT